MPNALTTESKDFPVPALTSKPKDKYKSPIDTAGLYGTDYSSFKNGGFTGTMVGVKQPTTVNINVSGAVDPKATAIAVQKAINKANRMGINGKFLGNGLGN